MHILTGCISLYLMEDIQRNCRIGSFLKELHRIEFTYSIPMDGNRAEDGVDLRYRFGYENGYSSSMISTYLDNRMCSVLEMMIALAIRCEEHIMDDPDVGNRTGQWFWNMIVNLGLGSMNDSKFDRDYVEDIVQRFWIGSIAAMVTAGCLP